MRAATAGLLFLGVGLAAIVLAGTASADTAIPNATVDTLFVLEVAGSPYTLDHDIHVLPGGFLLVSDGVHLRMLNGSRIVGDGGSISATGTALTPAVIEAWPAGDANAWVGIEIQNGTTLRLRNAALNGAQRAVTFLGIATLDAQFVDFGDCLEWCVSAGPGGHVSLLDSSMVGGGWAVRDNGSVTPVVTNLTVDGFTGGGLWFGPGASAAAVSRVSVTNSAAGIVVDRLFASTFAGVFVAVNGTALSGNASTDITVHNSTLSSYQGVALDDRGSARLTLRDTAARGITRAVALNSSSASSLVRVHFGAPNGVCLFVLNMTNAVLRGNTFDECRRTLAVDPQSAPPSADADRSNTVNGKPVVWISNVANARVDVRDNAGLVVVSAVSGATLSDLRLRGAGVHIFGSTDVLVERVLVEDAEAGVVAIGTRGLDIRQLVARNVSVGIRVWSSAFFPAAQDIAIEGVRVEGASQDGISLADTLGATVLRAYARAGAAGVNLSRATTVLVQYGFIENSSYGVRVSDSTDVTVVDTVIARNSVYGALITNVTGYAARNAFIDNGAHASSPSAPGFPFDELGGGNYWSGFTGPNVNGDLFYDTPYNFSDATGQDRKPRVGRLDFSPTVIVLPPAVLEAGVEAHLDGSLSFDDFQVATIYWTVVLPGGNATGSGPSFPFTPPSTGNFTVIAEARDNGAFFTSYAFQVVVRDTIAPRPGLALLGRPEVGTNLTVALPNATDNDPGFPAGAFIEWMLVELLSPTLTGNSTALNFTVPIGAIGSYTLRIHLFDGAGNQADVTVNFTAADTTPPQVEFLYEGMPDIGVPFKIDASQAIDPVGVVGASAVWRWFDEASAHNISSWPAVNITFRDGGNHTVNLTLCDTGGNCGVFALTLEVRDRSPPRLTVIRVIAPGQNAVEVVAGANPLLDLQLNQDIVFEIVAADPSGPVTFSWNFGDGGRAEGARVTHRFAALGTGVVNVAMTDGAGNSNTTGLRVNIVGGGILTFFTEGPGVLIVLAVAAAAGVGVFFLVRYRRMHRKNY